MSDETGEAVDAESGNDTETERSDEAETPATTLVEHVAAYDENLAAEVAAMEADLEAKAEAVEDLEERVDELESKLKRKQADFQNFKKRQERKREQLEQRATEDLVEKLVPVRDNLVRALEQDENADIRDGVESTLQQFDDVLADENVSTIDPETGEDVDPQRHEVMMRVESDEPEGTVASLFEPGYEMGEKVIRAAKVTVSEGEGQDEA